MNDFSQLESLIQRVGKREAELSDTTPLHFPMLQDYLAKARRLAQTTLSALRPLDVSVADWALRVDSLVKGVRVYVLKGGMYLTIEPQNQREGQVSDVDFVEISNWIQAGLNGEGGDAKRITAEDRKIISEHGLEQGKRIIAIKVSRAFYSTNPKANYAKMRRAIQGYLGGNKGEEASSGMLEAVLVVWKEVLGVSYLSDMRKNFRF